MRDDHGHLIQFGIPLERDDGDLAELVRTFARWIADLAADEIQAQRRAVHQATAPK
jgi:hypothetical protein